MNQYSLFKLIRIPNYRIIAVIALSVAEAFFVVSGIALLLPFAQYIIMGEQAVINGPEFKKYIAPILNIFGLEVGAGSLAAIAFVPLILQQVITYVKEVEVARIVHLSVLRLRTMLMKNIFSARLSFFDSVRHGLIANVIMTDAEKVGLTIKYAVSSISSALVVAVYLCACLMISWKLTLVSMLLLSIPPLLIKFVRRRLNYLGNVIARNSGELNAFISEKIRAIRKVHLNNQGSKELEHFLRTSREQYYYNVKASALTGVIRSSMEPLFGMSIIAIIWIGHDIVKISFSEIMIMIVIFYKTKNFLKLLIDSMNQVGVYEGNLLNLISFRDETRQAAYKHPGTQLLGRLKAGIKLESIQFDYDLRTVLDNLILEFPKNQFSAIVGQSGSGKTTLLNILTGFLQVSKGSVLFDNQDISVLDLASVRQRIGFLSQDHVIFNDSIRQNLTYGLDREVSDSEILEVCEKANIREFVESLPDGLDSFCGEDGRNLSGGQRQRLLLAQLLLRDPDIIILDEPTSALDSHTEKAVMDTIFTLKGDKTVIIVAHRLSTIQRCDRIVVLEQGRVVESGSHNQLLAANGQYAKMFS